MTYQVSMKFCAFGQSHEFARIPKGQRRDDDRDQDRAAFDAGYRVFNFDKV